MPRANVAETIPDADGQAPTVQVVAQADGAMFPAGDRTCVRCVNDDGAAARTVTIQTPKEIGGLAVAEVAVSVPAVGGVRYIGPFDSNVFAQTSGADAGKVYLDVSGAGVSIEVIRVP